LRWVFEALTGGDLSDIEPEWFYDRNNDKAEEERKSVKLELEQIIRSLRKKEQIIIGHNLFTDLGFLYNTFIGCLPGKVEHFQEAIHGLFPRVIDTKYLATQGADSMNPRTNLKELLGPFKKIQLPLILLHQEHTAYGTSFGKEHEAGYDSWMTAELFVKLTAKLYTECKTQLGDADEEYISEDVECMTFSDDDSEADNSPTIGGVSLFTSNPFQALQPKTKNMKNAPVSWEERQLEGKKRTKNNRNEADNTTTGQWIPPISNRFWEVYINKLRVTGSEGGVCDLAEESKSSGQ